MSGPRLFFLHIHDDQIRRLNHHPTDNLQTQTEALSHIENNTALPPCGDVVNSTLETAAVDVGWTSVRSLTLCSVRFT